MRTTIFIAALTLGAASLGPPDPASPTRFAYSEVHMGTEFRIVLYAPDAEHGAAAAHAAFDRVAQLDAALSDYRPDSELMRLCGQAGGPPVPVSPELFEVLEHAQNLAGRSAGAFDVTVAPVVRLWRRARRNHQMPDPARLARALELVGSSNVRLDAATRSVQLLKPGMQLDLGGIAKGYAADQAIQELERHGIDRALVAASGDIVVSRPPPGEPGWSVAVATVDASKPGARPRVLSLEHAAVSTSGDLEQFVELNGKRYSHVIDPHTGLGLVEHATVTVVAPRGITADSLATAVNVLGPERGLKLVETTEGTAALIVRQDGDRTVSFESQRFASIPRAKPKERSGETTSRRSPAAAGNER